MRPATAAVAAVLATTIAATSTLAGPILKPRKYSGPIPRNAVTLRLGFLGGADDAEMIEFLDGRIAPPFESFSEDFGNGLNVGVEITRKMHPRFAFRGHVGATFLRSSGSGRFVPSVAGLPDSVAAPAVDYTRDFDVDLVVVEASGMYFFSDAAVREFQPYAGGGFSVGLPHATYAEKQVVTSATDGYFTNGETFQTIERDEWSFEAGVHALLGAYYYVTNLFAVNVEGRFQLMQSSFPLETVNEIGGRETVRFVVDYTGFYLGLGLTRAF